MKTKNFYIVFLCILFSCDFPSDNSDYNREGYREGSNLGKLENDGLLVGAWEQTYRWSDGDGEFPSKWSPVNETRSRKYVFLDDNTFTSENTISNCTQNSGTYSVDGTKIKLEYFCEESINQQVLINEFFFRENFIVFIIGKGTSDISKFELIK